MKSDFFIDRPVFSTVISVIIVLVGFIGLTLLPVDQYPDIVPPVVRVTASYPGASAQTVAQAVATPIEQELNGTPGMLYMQSTNTNSGSFTANITFDISSNPDLAAVEVQNRVKQAEARLPAEVVQNGISVEKVASNKLVTVTLLTDDPKFDEIYLSNYATLNVLDMLRRVPGVGRVSNVGSRYYAMQIWVQPDKLASLGLTVKDLQNALQDQNRESAAGVLGQQPIEDVDITIPITATGRLSSVSQFENIVIRAGQDGSIIRLKDVARVSLEAQSYNTESGINGGNAAVMDVYMLPGANALEVAENVKKEMEEIRKQLDINNKNLKRLKSYAVKYLTSLLEKYGPNFPRRTKIELEGFQKIDMEKIALNNIRVYWDRKGCYVGTNVKSDDVVVCNEFDHLLKVGILGQRPGHQYFRIGDRPFKKARSRSRSCHRRCSPGTRLLCNRQPCGSGFFF